MRKIAASYALVFSYFFCPILSLPAEAKTEYILRPGPSLNMGCACMCKCTAIWNYSSIFTVQCTATVLYGSCCLKIFFCLYNVIFLVIFEVEPLRIWRRESIKSFLIHFKRIKFWYSYKTRTDSNLKLYICCMLYTCTDHVKGLPILQLFMHQKLHLFQFKIQEMPFKLFTKQSNLNFVKWASLRVATTPGNSWNQIYSWKMTPGKHGFQEISWKTPGIIFINDDWLFYFY